MCPCGMSVCPGVGLPAGSPSGRAGSRARLGWQQHRCVSYQQIAAAVTCSLLDVVSLRWLRVSAVSGM